MQGNDLNRLRINKKWENRRTEIYDYKASVKILKAQFLFTHLCYGGVNYLPF